MVMKNIRLITTYSPRQFCGSGYVVLLGQAIVNCNRNTPDDDSEMEHIT